MDTAHQEKNRIKILVVDDHPLIRQGIIYVLSMQSDIIVAGEACNGLEAIEQAKAIQPDLILMDIKMPYCNGIEATRRILAEFPEIRIVILTVSSDDQDLFQAIEAGARGYLIKNLEPQPLVDMIRGVFHGEAPISRMGTARIMQEFARRASGNNPSLEDLSQREVQVLRLVAKGYSNKEVAQKLEISLHTVKNHIRNILDKLHKENRMQAVVFAVKEGVLDTNKFSK